MLLQRWLMQHFVNGYNKLGKCQCFVCYYHFGKEYCHPLHLDVVAIEMGAFESLSTKVTNNHFGDGSGYIRV